MRRQKRRVSFKPSVEEATEAQRADQLNLELVEKVSIAVEDAEENLTNDVVTVIISLQSWTQCRTSQTNLTIFSLQMFFMSNNFHRPRHTGALHLQLKVNE